MVKQGTKAIKLKDFNNTIILIDENADPEVERKKYIQDLKDYKYSNMKSLIKDKNLKNK